MTSGREAIEWIEETIVVPSGPLVGQPMRLFDFQKQILLGIFDSGTATRRALISFARQNGKTLLASCLTLLHLCGPRYQRNGLLVSTGLSREQASLLFDYCAKIVRASPMLAAVVQVVDHLKQLRCAELGTLYRALSSDAPSQYGMSPFFAVHDELGQIDDESHELYDAVESGMISQLAPLSVVISTQAADDRALLSQLLDRAVEDSATRAFLWVAAPEMDPFSDEALRAANPAFDHFVNQAELRAQAASAKRMPSLEPAYRNLHLNQRIDQTTFFCAPAVWEENGAAPGPLDGSAIVIGLDIGMTRDLNAIVTLADDGSVHTFCFLPEAGLAEKSREDSARYVELARDGYLLTTPGDAVSLEHVAIFLRKLFGRCTVRAVAYDPALFKFLRPWLEKAGFTEAEIETTFVAHRQGFYSMHGAVRELETRLLERKLKHGNHPVLKMCAINARVAIDSSGSRKFVKKASRGRMDAIVALAMACSAQAAIPKPAEYSFFVLQG